MNELIAKRLIALIEAGDSLRCPDTEKLYYLLPVEEIDRIVEALLGPPVLLPREMMARVAAIRAKAANGKGRSIYEWQLMTDGVRNG